MGRKRHDLKDFWESQGRFAAICKKRLRIALFVLAGIMAMAAAAVFLQQWNEGEQAGKQAEGFLKLTAKPSQSPEYFTVLITIQPDTYITEGLTLSPSNSSVLATISQNPYTSATCLLQSPKVEKNIFANKLEGYTVIARLDISKLKLHLPVLSLTSVKALKVSICYYRGAEPGMDGNLVITGHNYRDGTFFGRLKRLVLGDFVSLTAKDGITDIYTVYKIDHIQPDDFEALDATKYAKELTLITCEANGTRRLLVRCKAEN